MKTLILEVEVDDDFEPGECYACPIGVCDYNNDCDIYCPAYSGYENCPLHERKE